VSNAKSGTSAFTIVCSAVAVCLSWSVNHSILWAIFHGLCSWIYIVYHICKYYL
jgi:hypothetical protein